MRAILLACAALSLMSCGVPYPRYEAAQYRQGLYERGYAINFVPGTADPEPDDLQALADLRRTLRGDTQIRLALSGPLATQRAARVEAALGRPLEAEVVERSLFSGPGRNEADLILLTPGIVADACTRPNVRVGRTLWVIGDYSRQELLPPGCAVATMIMEQAADRRDVLRGRILEPGAAGPMARAADRYLRRNDGVQAVRNQERGGGGGQQQDEQEQQGAAPGAPGPSSGQGPAAPAGGPLPAPAAATGSGSGTAPAR